MSSAAYSSICALRYPALRPSGRCCATGKIAPAILFRYAILLRALRGVLLRKTGKFAPSEFVGSGVLALHSYKTKDRGFERSLMNTIKLLTGLVVL
jgi:hypothetical protein